MSIFLYVFFVLGGVTKIQFCMLHGIDPMNQPLSVRFPTLEHGHVTLVPTRSEERGVLGAGSFPVAILPSCHMKTIALQLHKYEYS